MPSSPSRSSASSYVGKDGKIDPITRTALRYSISPREYELLHQYLISRAPKRVRRKAPEPEKFEKIVQPKRNGHDEAAEGEDYRVESLRFALRAFVGAYVGFKGWEVITEKLATRRQYNRSTTGAAAASIGKARHPNFRYALSLSTILLFHRLLHRFFLRLRSSLSEISAEAFRKRNPRVSRLLTSAYTPAIGAALSGTLLGLAPADQLRMTIAIYTFTRSLEFAYNAASSAGYIWQLDEDGRPKKPSWFGSWMIMPFACGQLLHAFVFDRECFPESYGRFILARSPEYIQLRPQSYPKGKSWPYVFEIVDSLAQISRLRWPAFTSPILFPALKETLPPSLARISPVTAPAHPGIKHTSCALLHPKDPSCGRTYLKYFIQAFPAVAKFFTLIYGAFALLAYKRLMKDPASFLNNLSARILRMSLFITGAIGTSWGSICLFSNLLPRTTLPTQRWFLGGFIGGLWAYVARHGERSNFLYSARLSIDSLWKVGVKRGWWRGLKNGDVLVFVASLALLDVVYERHPKAVDSAFLRKGLGVLRGDGWVDRAIPPKASVVDAKEEQEEGASQGKTSEKEVKDH